MLELKKIRHTRLRYNTEDNGKTSGGLQDNGSVQMKIGNLPNAGLYHLSLTVTNAAGSTESAIPPITVDTSAGAPDGRQTDFRRWGGEGGTSSWRRLASRAVLPLGLEVIENPTKGGHLQQRSPTGSQIKIQ